MTVEFKDKDDLLQFCNSGLELSERDDKHLRCSVKVYDEDINAFISAVKSLKIKGFSEHSVTLEEYFMHFYKKDRATGGVCYA